MRYIARTLARKQLSKEASDYDEAYMKYEKMVQEAHKAGISDEQIRAELEFEKQRILTDSRDGDHIFQEGLHNAKVSCISAITMIISRLKEN